MDGVIPLAFACLLLAYVESVSAARALAQANGYEIDARQELLGLGAANLAAAAFQAYPVAGGLSQSSVNDKAGAKTPLALVFASVTIGVCLLYLTGLLSNLPNVVLAAIVLVAVKGLINMRELRHVWQVSRFEFSVSMVAFAGVLLLGILKGVMLAVVVSMLMLIRRAAQPHVALLGRIPGTRSFSDMERNPDNEAIPGVLVFRVEASLLYFNVEHVRDAARQAIRAVAVRPKLVVCDLSTSPTCRPGRGAHADGIARAPAGRGDTPAARRCACGGARHPARRRHWRSASATSAAGSRWRMSSTNSRAARGQRRVRQRRQADRPVARQVVSVLEQKGALIGARTRDCNTKVAKLRSGPDPGEMSGGA